MFINYNLIFNNPLHQQKYSNNIKNKTKPTTVLLLGCKVETLVKAVNQ